MNIKNTVKTLATTALMTIATYGGLLAQDSTNVVSQDNKNKIEFSSDFNQLEVDGLQGKVRSINKASIGNDKFGLAYHGLNEITSANPDTYFGLNRLILNTNEYANPMLATKWSLDGIFDSKVGLRNESLPELAGADYGFLDALTDGSAVELMLFAGKGITDNLSLEALQTIQVENEIKPGYFSELQLNYKLGEKVSAFGRVESVNFKDPLYVAGLLVNF